MDEIRWEVDIDYSRQTLGVEIIISIENDGFFFENVKYM